MSDAEAIENTEILSIEAANDLVVEHRGWAESIARSVARSWNLDWQLDGLDGSAMEALIFCSRRFKPDMGVPFKGYARRRIHEASTEAARKSKGWRKNLSTSHSHQEDQAREISLELLNVFPELRDGQLPSNDDEGSSDDSRGAVRQLLMGASLLAARDTDGELGPEEALDFKRIVKVIAGLETVHQVLLWKVYWEGLSLRSVAAEWETDGLNVIREHRNLLMHLHKCMASHKVPIARPKVRPGLRPIAIELKKSGKNGPFFDISQERR